MAVDQQAAATALQHLQEEQVRAAWVQAWAGIAQAIGALLAIGVSIYLTLMSAKRERAADANAEARARAAEAAAEDRARAADAAALFRAENAQRLAHNEPFDLVGAHADIVIQQLRAQEEKYRQSTERATFVVGIASPETAAVAQAAEIALQSVRSATAAAALRKVIQAMAGRERFTGEVDQVVAFFGKAADDLEAARNGLEAVKLPIPTKTPS